MKTTSKLFRQRSSCSIFSRKRPLTPVWKGNLSFSAGELHILQSGDLPSKLDSWNFYLLNYSLPYFEISNSRIFL